MRPTLETAALPADAIEIGRIADAWGIKGWFKVLPHSASPEALFSSKQWFLLPPDRPMKPPRAAATAPQAAQPAWTGPVLLQLKEVKDHSDTVVACAQGIDDRNAAESLRGARIFVPRSSFPAAAEGEYYWVDLSVCKCSTAKAFCWAKCETSCPRGRKLCWSSSPHPSKPVASPWSA